MHVSQKYNHGPKPLSKKAQNILRHELHRQEPHGAVFWPRLMQIMHDPNPETRSMNFHRWLDALSDEKLHFRSNDHQSFFWKKDCGMEQSVGKHRCNEWMIRISTHDLGISTSGLKRHDMHQTGFHSNMVLTDTDGELRSQHQSNTRSQWRTKN